MMPEEASSASPLGSPQPITIVTAAQGGFGIFRAQMGTVLTAGTHTLTAQLTDPNYTAPVSNAQTVTVAVMSFWSSDAIQWGRIMAGSFIVLIPGVVFVLTCQRWLVKGLTMGSVKG